MSKKGTSIPDLFGGYTHYDEKGRKIGESVPGLFGGYTEYDEKGKVIGHTYPDLFGGYDHYDEKGKKTGDSIPDLFGGYTNYDTKGHRVGSSDPKLFGGYTQRGGNANINRGYVEKPKQESTGSGSQSGNCYIATCVYGTYDCPEVRILRRFRDLWLAERRLGRQFIRTYYRYSPGLVAKKGGNRAFRKFWRKSLDCFTAFLKKRGYVGEPYEDRNDKIF
jgi:hypothetical protein